MQNLVNDDKEDSQKFSSGVFRNLPGIYKEAL